MPPTRLRGCSLPHAAVRAGVAVLVAGIFLYAASVIEPDDSLASTGKDSAETSSSAPGRSGSARDAAARDGNHSGATAAEMYAPAPEGEPASLGSLSGPQYSVRIRASQTGPLYTILDDNGLVLAEDLTAEQASEQFPDLDLAGMQAGMMATADVPF